jgi:tripeptide aminopeptidase
MVDKERIIKNFIELVSIPCPTGDEKAEADLIISKLHALGVETKVDKAGAGGKSTTGNVWGFLPGNVKGAPTVLFEGHMDSVAPTTGTKVVRKNGMLYSDGTTTLGGDDKVGIASVLEALQIIHDEKLPHGDVQILCAIGEETGSIGVRNLDPSWIKAEVGYCLDSLGGAGEIYNYSPRAYKVVYKVHGKAAHAGEEPEKGINAIMLIAKALSKLPWYGRLDKMTTMSIGLIEGGKASNIVAEDCSVTVDMRCPDTKKLNELRDATTKIFADVVKAGGGTLTTECSELGPAVFVKESEPVCKLAAKAAEKAGFPVQFKFSGGLSDANFLCGYNLPTVNLGCGMDKIHTTEEQLAEKDLVNTAAWVVSIITTATEK